jgi:hypothetical protein
MNVADPAQHCVTIFLHPPAGARRWVCLSLQAPNLFVMMPILWTFHQAKVMLADKECIHAPVLEMCRPQGPRFTVTFLGSHKLVFHPPEMFLLSTAILPGAQEDGQ